MKKVIVTGGLGFIGSNLVNILIKKKYFVINIDKVTYSSNFYNVRNLLKNKNYKFIKLDINNSKKTFQILKKYKPHVIFNLAAETHVDRSIDGPKKFITSNILGVFNLLQAFRRFVEKNKKSKLIHVSTDEVYGDVLLGRSKENDAYKPSSPYAATKASADHICMSYYYSFNLPITILRPFNTYGPRQSTRAVIPTIINQISKKVSRVKLGSINTTRDFNYVEDTVSAYIKTLRKDKKLDGEIINVGSNFEVSIKDIYKIVCKFYSRNPKIEIDKKRFRPIKSEVKRLYSCNKKAKKLLKWKPMFSGKKNFYKGIYKTCEWFEKNKKNSNYKSTDYTI